MSLPSVAKEKTSNKVSLVTIPSVTLVQPVQVIGSQPQQPKRIFVQSIQTIQQPSIQPPAFITTKVNKPRPLSQPVTIAPIIKTHPRPVINKLVAAVPLTSSQSTFSSIASAAATTTQNRLQSFQLKTPNIVVSTNSPATKSIIVGQTIVSSRISLNDKQQGVAKITKVSTATPFPAIAPKRTTTTAAAAAPPPPPPTSTKRGGLTIEKIVSFSSNNSSTSSTSSSHHKTVAALNVAKLDPVKVRYRTILENLLQLKNNFIRRTITQAIQQKLANQSNEDLLNVIFKSFELTLLSVNIEQIYLNVSRLFFVSYFKKSIEHVLTCVFSLFFLGYRNNRKHI